MSIQEYFGQNGFDGKNSIVGNLDLVARVVYASHITLDKPYLNNPKGNLYQWVNGGNINATTSVVNSLFSITGNASPGTFYMPSQASLDEYFETTDKGIVFSLEFMNTTGGTYTVNNNGADILLINTGSFNQPSYNKYYFCKVEDNGQYVCFNNTTETL